VANVGLGETYQFPGRDGKPLFHTNWHNLVFYNEVADVAMTYEQGENIQASRAQSRDSRSDVSRDRGGANRTTRRAHSRAQ
jgi:hypothetical protein